jgi:hypothetical protein
VLTATRNRRASAGALPSPCSWANSTRSVSVRSEPA